MDSQSKPEKMSLHRQLFGLGFFLLLLGVVIGAAMKGAGDFPKYIAAAAILSMLAGGIAAALRGWTHRAH
jgi:hypothetical protein